METRFILFGASGDLSKIKIIPALHDLYQEFHWKSSGYRSILIGRKESDDAACREYVKEVLHDKDPQLEVTDDFLDLFEYQKINSQNPEEIFTLENHITDPSVLVFYLAIPPQAFREVLGMIREFKEKHPEHEYRVIVEKPFGTDLESAQDLNRCMREFLREREIYRIDHYLGKETVQNILALRFGNTMFEPLLNNHYVEKIELDLFEEQGIRDRADYFDDAGIIKDVFQNHILQVLALLMMEPPYEIQGDAIRDQKYTFLKSLGLLDLRRVKLGQYLADEEKGIKGYLEEEGVKERSTTETFASVDLEVKNMRWDGVPVFIKVGKRMPNKKMEIRIFFKPTYQFFMHPSAECQPAQNVLVIGIQPDEEVYYSVNAKFPGKGMCIQPVKLHFTYQESFNVPTKDAYTRLLKDVFDADQTLFIRSDEIEAAWRYVTPLLEAKKAGQIEVRPYKPGEIL
jgi:glucose-6-phosphate 1-dehydrogenase